MTLAQMESRFFELKGKLTVGQIADDDFKREMEKLRFQDPQGRWWMLGAQSGRWYFYDGARWQLGQPAEPSAPVPTTPVSLPEERPSAAPLTTLQNQLPSTAVTSGLNVPFYGPARHDSSPDVTPASSPVTPPQVVNQAAHSAIHNPTLAERVREDLTHVHLPAVHVPPLQLPHTPAPIRRYPPNAILIGAVLIGLVLVAVMWLAVDNVVPGKPISSFLAKTFGGASAVTSPAARPTALPAGANNLANLLRVGDELVSKSQFEPGIAQYQTASKVAPSEANVYAHWARALALTGRIQEAVNTAQRATHLDANSANAFAELTRAQAWSGQAPAAITAGEKAIALDPKSPTAHAFLAEAYLRAGRQDDASKESDAALGLDDSNVDAHRAAGWLAVVGGRKEEAIGEWQRVVTLAPEIFFYHFEFGQVYGAYLNDPANATTEYQKAIDLYPSYVPSYLALGRSYLSQNQPAPAILQFQKAVTFDPNSSEAYTGLGLAFQKSDRCSQAIPYLQKAIALSGGLNEAARGLADCGALAKDQPTPPALLAPTPGLIAVPTAIAQSTVVPLAASSPSPIKPGAPTSKTTLTGTAKGTPPLVAASGRLAFSVFDGQYHLYIANADGSNRKLVADLGMDPEFSADGSQLLYSSWTNDARGIHRIAANGSSDSQVSQRNEDVLPSWSPDGSRYVYATRAGLGSDITKRAYSIRVADASSKATQDPPPFVERAQYPNWGSNDKIVFRDCGFPTDTCGLSVVNSDGSGKTEVTNINSTAPAWSPDASRVAFTSDYGGNWDIYIINASGGSPSRLTTDAAEDGLPTFSPDGKQIAFLSHRGGIWAIWVMGIDGSNQRKLFDLGGAPAGTVPGSTSAQPGQVWYEQKISWR